MKNYFKDKLIVSIEQAVAAPYCTAKFADAGARVIKVERKEGDFARYYDDFVKGDSTYFVWLNRGKESLVANKSVTINEPFFQGHFPNRPIMPGVLIVEAMAQAASCLVVLENENKDSTNLSVFLMKIDKARFRKPITPGDQIRMEVKKEKSRGDVWQFYGESFVDDQLACEASFAAMVVRLDEAQND